MVHVTRRHQAARNNSGSRLRAGRSFAVVILFCTTMLRAAPPALETLFPCGGKAASTFKVTATGSNLEKAFPSVWADHPGISFKPADKPKVFEVTVAPYVPPGPHLVRFSNAEGASVPHVFVIGVFDEVEDTEPNDDFLRSQVITKLPVTMNGRLEKSGDVDTFAVKLEAGRTFVADLQGYALGSQMDPAMKLLDDRGVEIALSHDTHNLDPRITFAVTKAGTYHVQIMAFAHPPAADVTLKGSAAHIYRLTLTDQPFAFAAEPCAIQRSTQGTVKLLQTSAAPQSASLDATQSTANEATLRAPAPNGEIVLAALTDTPVIRETEPNNDAAKAQRIISPATVSGTIQSAKDEDRFLITAQKGDEFALRVHAADLHSPLDAWLRIEDASGSMLQQADDANELPDPMLKWKAPKDGDYILAVGDLFSRGGAEFVYALECRPPAPDLTSTLEANTVKLDAGKTAELKVTTKATPDFKSKLSATVQGLPPGVTVKPVEVPVKGGELKLTLSATAEAPAASVPVEVVITGAAPDAVRTFKATYDLRGTEPRGDRLINADSRVWLNVTPSPAAKPAPAAASSPSVSAKPPAAAPAPKP